MVGPTIQSKIFTYLVRFHTYRYVLTADIEKMYRQVLLHEDDRKYQRICDWRRLGPIVLYAKRLMQDVWRCKLQWDESVPQSVHTDWARFAHQLSTMDRVPFNRGLLMRSSFTDFATQAVSAMAPVCTCDHAGNTGIRP